MSLVRNISHMAKAKSRAILTPVECEVMQVVWNRKDGTTANDVMRELKRPIAYTTALSMLRILEQKGYLAHEAHPEGGRAHLFRPTVPERVARRSHVRDLIGRLFHGEANALVSGLLEEERFSRDALESLRAQIDEKLGQGDKKEKKGSRR
jgi:BlaI family transcriptional regulator, penicillinase repressor